MNDFHENDKIPVRQAKDSSKSRPGTNEDDVADTKNSDTTAGPGHVQKDITEDPPNTVANQDRHASSSVTFEGLRSQLKPSLNYGREPAYIDVVEGDGPNKKYLLEPNPNYSKCDTAADDDDFEDQYDRNISAGVVPDLERYRSNPTQPGTNRDGH